MSTTQTPADRAARRHVTGPRRQYPAYEITPVGKENVELRTENKRLRAALQSIADESQKHHEHNPVSDVTRLPGGYVAIMNTATQALR